MRTQHVRTTVSACEVSIGLVYPRGLRTRVPARPSAPAQDLCTHKDKRNPVIPPAQRNALRVIRDARRWRGTALESARNALAHK